MPKILNLCAGFLRIALVLSPVVLSEDSEEGEKKCCVWTAWGSSCSSKCGPGMNKRHLQCKTREVNDSEKCVQVEDGIMSETKSCIGQNCPCECNWNEWGRCSVSCGTGHRHRQMHCSSTQPWHPCKEEGVEEISSCLKPACCACEWGAWSACSHSCGGGMSRRKMVCNDASCKGGGQTKLCNQKPCCDCTWQQWTSCTTTCGEGFQASFKRCRQKSCPGSGERKTRRCHDRKERTCCKCSWASWGTCSVSCGTGIVRRIKNCKGCQPHEVGHISETKRCDKPQCCKCSWSPWSSECSKTCGEGSLIRKMQCNVPTCRAANSVLHHGSVDRKECKVADCCQCGWASWGGCSTTCGYGQKVRVFKCNHNHCPNSASKEPAAGTTQTALCFLAQCCSCTWGAWDSALCSRSCGEGTQAISNTCNSRKCHGHGKELRRKCKERECCKCALSKWTGCDVTCGNGTMSRQQKCNIETCPGNGELSFRQCSMKSCCQCHWAEWTKKCSVSCGKGHVSRRYICNSAECRGHADVQGKSCERPVCCRCKWGPWSKCSASCGSGKSKRTQTCNRNDCSGHGIIQTHDCTGPPCCRCAWVAWSSGCSVTCGQGVKYYFNKCNDRSCPDHNKLKTETCHKQKCCNCNWAAWTHCSASCGAGKISRKMKCDWPEPTCPKNGFSISRTCRMPTCCSCTWSEWTSKCSVSCGVGTVSRVRTCNMLHCESSVNRETKKCVKPQCCHCSWSEWTRFCSTTCGKGVHTRTYVCDHSSCPKHGDFLRKKCKAQPPCCICKWNNWSEKCSKTCGYGLTFRTKVCNRGSCDDHQRVGSRVCSKNPTCPQLCVCHNWAEWSAWAACSATCGHGTSERARACKSGNFCPSDIETRDCNYGKCFIPGTCHCSEWGPWSRACSAACGLGVKQRKRNCKVVAPECITRHMASCMIRPCPSPEELMSDPLGPPPPAPSMADEPNNTQVIPIEDLKKADMIQSQQTSILEPKVATETKAVPEGETQTAILPPATNPEVDQTQASQPSLAPSVAQQPQQAAPVAQTNPAQVATAPAAGQIEGQPASPAAAADSALAEAQAGSNPSGSLQEAALPSQPVPESSQTQPSVEQQGEIPQSTGEAAPPELALLKGLMASQTENLVQPQLSGIGAEQAMQSLPSKAEQNLAEESKYNSNSQIVAGQPNEQVQANTPLQAPDFNSMSQAQNAMTQNNVQGYSNSKFEGQMMPVQNQLVQNIEPGISPGEEMASDRWQETNAANELAQAGIIPSAGQPEPGSESISAQDALVQGIVQPSDQEQSMNALQSAPQLIQGTAENTGLLTGQSPILQQAGIPLSNEELAGLAQQVQNQGDFHGRPQPVDKRSNPQLILQGPELQQIQNVPVPEQNLALSIPNQYYQGNQLMMPGENSQVAEPLLPVNTRETPNEYESRFGFKTAVKPGEFETDSAVSEQEMFGSHIQNELVGSGEQAERPQADHPSASLSQLVQEPFPVQSEQQVAIEDVGSPESTGELGMQSAHNLQQLSDVAAEPMESA